MEKGGGGGGGGGGGVWMARDKNRRIERVERLKRDSKVQYQ